MAHYNMGKDDIKIFVDCATEEPESFVDFINFVYDHSITVEIIPCNQYSTIRFKFTKSKTSSSNEHVCCDLYTGDMLNSGVLPPSPWHYIIRKLKHEFNIL